MDIFKKDILTRPHDIGRDDACVTIKREPYYRHPIDIWLDKPRVKEMYTPEEIEQLRLWVKAKVPLNPRRDEPMPNWVVDLLRLGRIGYKARIAIALMHAEDIYRYSVNKPQEEGRQTYHGVHR